VINNDGRKNRSLVWEDETPAEPRFRRVEQSAPPLGRPLPGMPLEMADPDEEVLSRLGGSSREWPGRPWWRPSGTVGRTFLSLAVLLVLAGFAISSYLLKTYMGRDGRFRIAGASNIEAVGLTEVNRSDLLPVFGEDIGRNIFFVPLSERRKQLEEIPWIERATVMRLLPDQIRVAVVERQPVAFVRQGQQIGLVDANGVLLSMPASMMAQHHYSFPVVTGLDPGDPLPSRKARMAVYQRLLGELDSNGQRLSEQISEIDLTDPEDARVLMPEQGTDILAHFGEDHFLERYQRYKSHIAEWRQQYPKLAAVDLRYVQQVVLEMAPGSSAVPAAGDAQAVLGAGQDDTPHPGDKSVNKAVTGLANAALDKHGKPPSKAKPAKAPGKAAVKSSEKAKMAARMAQAKMREKKLAEAKRAALNTSKRKAAPTAIPADSAGMGQ
jgi:cell division protein FtsQ